MWHDKLNTKNTEEKSDLHILFKEKVNEQKDFKDTRFMDTDTRMSKLHLFIYLHVVVIIQQLRLTAYH